MKYIKAHKIGFLTEKWNHINENETMVKSLINVINDLIENGKFNDAKETFIALKNTKIGDKSVLEIPEYTHIFKGLEDKLTKAIGGAKTASEAEAEAKRIANSPEAKLEAAKHCNFENAKLGYMNGWNPNGVNYKILKLHDKCREKDPENHKTTTHHPYGRNRGISETSCPCGISYGVDSTD